MRQLRTCLTAVRNGSFKIYDKLQLCETSFVSLFFKKLRNPLKYLFKGRPNVLCNIHNSAEFFGIATQTDSQQYYQILIITQQKLNEILINWRNESVL